MMEAGLGFALGTDNCALDDNEDYLPELRLGRLLGRSAAAPPAEQLRAFLATATERGADAAFLDGTGRIGEGLKADLVAIDLSAAEGAYLDPDGHILEAMLARATGRDVVMTMVEGKILCRNGRATGTDAGSLRAKLAEVGAALGREAQVAPAIEVLG